MEDIKDIDPYEVLGVSKESENKEIKRAYHKLCLKYHPDKNSGFRKEFDQVQLSYLVLSDEKKRKRFDRTGVMSVNGGNLEDEDFNWEEYFRVQFDEISKEMIDKDRDEYQGSAEELEDIRGEFVELKGDLAKLFEVIIHLEFSVEEEARIYGICEKFLEDGEVSSEEVPRWREYVAKRKETIKKLERKSKREARAAEKAQREMTSRNKKGHDAAGEDMASLQALIRGNAKRHRDQFDMIAEKYTSSSSRRGKKSKKN